MANIKLLKIVTEARLVAAEMCNSGCISQLPRATYMNHVDVIMVVTVSLIEALVFRSEERYVIENGRNVPTAGMKGLVREIAGIGEQEFNAPFSRFWTAAENELRGPDVGIRMMQDRSNIPYHTRIVYLCADWAIKTLSCGIMPSEVTGCSAMYNAILGDYERFCKLLLSELDFSTLPCTTGIEAFDLQSLPDSEVAYDVFISYRRIDGDVFARLINQEFEHRGIKCFLDVERMVNGEYRVQILSALKSALNFVFVMTEKALVGLDDPEDSLRIELEAAGRLDRRISIVAPPRVPRDLTNIYLPSTLEYLRGLNSYRLDVGENFESSIQKIIKQGLGR